MAYSEFTFQKLETDLHLITDEADLYSTVQGIKVSPALLDILDENVPLALAINTEKARSELIIAPVLVELRKSLQHRISLFSGVEFNVDPQRRLIRYPTVQSRKKYGDAMRLWRSDHG